MFVATAKPTTRLYWVNELRKLVGLLGFVVYILVAYILVVYILVAYILVVYILVVYILVAYILVVYKYALLYRI